MILKLHRCPECEEYTVNWYSKNKQFWCSNGFCDFFINCGDTKGLSDPPTEMQASQILSRAHEEYTQYKTFCAGKNGIEFIKPD